MFEHRKQALASKKTFLYRMILSIFLSIGITAFSLLIGIFGYHNLENLSWIDALLNASMILGGMGPIAILQTNAGKLFASFYALFSGMIFLVAVGILTAPIVHRFLHHFHLENKKDLN